LIGRDGEGPDYFSLANNQGATWNETLS